MNIFLLDFKEFLLKKALALYFRCKFLLPLFASIHYSFWQVFFGQRYISAILILITVVTALYGVGLWFSEKMYSLLTMSYSFYMSVLGESGTASVDWEVAVAPDRKMLHLLQLLTIFISRSGGGEELYTDLLNVVSSSIVSATVLTTVVLAIGIAMSIYTVRRDICLFREGKMSFDVSRLKHIDASAYIGSQAGAIICGWAVLFVFIFSALFFVSWGPFRDIFFGKGVMDLVIVSGVVYILSIAVARLAVRISPGIYIHFRPRWAMKELFLCVAQMGLAPFETAFRLFVAGFRNLCTWFWFQSSVYENEYIGSLGSMQYRSSLYLHHQHNNPIVRSMVERLHLELRNKKILRNFPMDNLEPAVIRDEIEGLKNLRQIRRTVSRILVMLSVRTNELRNMEARRKHKLALVGDSKDEVFLRR